MEFLSGLGVTTVPATSIIGRLALAVLFGACIGLDREWRRRAAGLRTHMLVSLAAATFTVLAAEIYAAARAAHPETSADPLLIIEAVTAGVAFLGAGSIIQSRGDVQGMTTGASMWAAGAIGLACGAGHPLIALAALMMTMLILTVVGYIQYRLGFNTPETAAASGVAAKTPSD